MSKDQTVQQLNVLLEKIDLLNQTKNEEIQCRGKLQNAQYYFCSKLDIFDSEQKGKFIAQRIGSEPSKPTGLIKLAVPVYLMRKSKYETEIKDYNTKYQLVEADYYMTYKSEREALAQSDKVEKLNAVNAAKSDLEMASKKHTNALAAVNSDATVSERFKNAEDIMKLIEFFNDGRADTLKEAVNLWFDEKRKDEESQKEEEHRTEMLFLERKRLDAAKAAEEYQRLQYLAAEEAARHAKEAAEKAEDAAQSAQFAVWNSNDKE